MSNLVDRLDVAGVIKLDLIGPETLELRHPLSFTVERGRAWVTVLGEPDDWFVCAGEVFTAPAGRIAWIQADPECRLSVAGRSLARSRGVAHQVAVRIGRIGRIARGLRRQPGLAQEAG